MATNAWLSTADGNYGTAANWSAGSIPAINEEVIIPAGTPSITAGLAQSGVAIGGFYVEEGYEGTIGDPANYLSIDRNNLDFAGPGLASIDLNAASNIP
ncbi:MAG: hypothetical protein IIA67_12670, partial [Planctomycetes bacterium]|nr:hypothetical protein [Planctomycetota bacterium]